MVKINTQKLLLQLDRGSVFSLDLPNGEQIAINLEEVSQLAPSYSLRVEDEFGVGARTYSPIRTFQGEKISGFGASLTITENFIQGQLPYNGGAWYIEPAQHLIPEAAPGTFLMYRVSDVILDENHTCGYQATEDKIEDFQKSVRNRQHQQRIGGQCIKIDLAIASDFEMFTTYGTVAATEAFIVGVINSMETDYQGIFQEDVEFTIVEQYVSTTATTSLETTLTSSTSASTLLTNFNTWGQSGSGFTSSYDLSQIWVERDIVGNTSSAVGVARRPGVCTENSRVAIFENFTTSAWQLRVLASHETGHNFGITHDASGSGFIMAPAINNTTSWSSQSTAEFEARVSATACVDGTYQLTGSPKVNFLTPSQLCIGQQITIDNRSGRNAGGFSWTMTGASPASSTATDPTISYSTTGIKTINLSSSNSDCGSSVTVSGSGSVDVIADSPPTAASCTPNTTNTSTTGFFAIGVRNVTVAGINNTTGDAGQTGNAYSDWSCQFMGTSSSSSIPFSATINNANTQTVEVYVDANNDGTFAASEEYLSQTVTGVGFSSSADVPVTGTLNLPAGAVQNQILRMRIIAVGTSSGAGVNGCTNSSFQEVEDYGLTLSVPLPVELVSFEATPKKSTVDLSWTVANEVDLYEYQIFHKSETEYWEKIATTEAKQKSSYSVVHPNSASGIHYYKLISVDVDGTQAESDIVAVTIKSDNKSIEVYPNPLAQGSGILQLNDWGVNEDVHIRVIDMSGKVVKTWETAIQASGAKIEQLHLQNLSAGLYSIEIKGAQQVDQMMIRL